MLGFKFNHVGKKGPDFKVSFIGYFKVHVQGFDLDILD